MAAIFSKSSVASSSSTSMLSSTVTMPTSRPSLSTTGRERKSYFISRATASSRSSPVPAVITSRSIRSATRAWSPASSSSRMVTTPSRRRAASVT